MEVLLLLVQKEEFKDHLQYFQQSHQQVEVEELLDQVLVQGNLFQGNQEDQVVEDQEIVELQTQESLVFLQFKDKEEEEEEEFFDWHLRLENTLEQRLREDELAPNDDTLYLVWDLKAAHMQFPLALRSV